MKKKKQKIRGMEPVYASGGFAYNIMGCKTVNTSFRRLKNHYTASSSARERTTDNDWVMVIRLYNNFG